MAGKKANELGHAVLLDPVGAGASAFRTETALKLIQEIKFDVIRGNISEIKTLALGSGTTKGVDADVADAVTEENLDQSIAFVKTFAEKIGCIIAVTGARFCTGDTHTASPFTGSYCGFDFRQPVIPSDGLVGRIQ